MENHILVIGGTGKTGRKVVQRLQDLGEQVRIGSRNGAPAFDWHQPATWPVALAGINKVYITFQPDLAVPGSYEIIQAFVEAAKQSSVQQLVLLSGIGEVEAQRCEQLVAQSGLDYTLVRASWFSQNFSESFLMDPILAGHVALPFPDAQIPYVDTDDIADVVVASLLDPKHIGQDYNLTGPRLWTFPALVQEIARATGREIAFTPISMEAYVKLMEEFQVPADYIWLVNYLFTEVLTSDAIQVISPDIERVLGRPARDFADYVRETAATGVWNPAVPAQ